MPDKPPDDGDHYLSEAATAGGGNEEEFETDDGRDEDLQEVFGLVEPSTDGAHSPFEIQLFNLSPRDAKLIDLVLRNAINDDLFNHMLAASESSKKGRSYERESDMDRRDFPPQFDPRYFRKAGFLYPKVVAKNPSTVLGFRAARAAQDLNLDGRKLQNKISACVATYWGEDTKPFEGLTAGFKGSSGGEGRARFKRLFERWRDLEVDSAYERHIHVIKSKPRARFMDQSISDSGID